LSGVAGRSGRKPQSEDFKMVKRLTPLDDIAFEKLEQGIEAGDFKFIRLYFEMRWGKPKQMQEVTVTNTEVPLFQINFKSTDEMNNL
jgi:hypothetical protein